MPIFRDKDKRAFRPLVAVIQHEGNAKVARDEQCGYEDEERRPGRKHAVGRVGGKRRDRVPGVCHSIGKPTIDAREESVRRLSRRWRQSVNSYRRRYACEQLLARITPFVRCLSAECIDIPALQKAVPNE
jgi:hypothetical protein